MGSLSIRLVAPIAAIQFPGCPHGQFFPKNLGVVAYVHGEGRVDQKGTDLLGKRVAAPQPGQLLKKGVRADVFLAWLQLDTHHRMLIRGIADTHQSAAEDRRMVIENRLTWNCEQYFS